MLNYEFFNDFVREEKKLGERSNYIFGKYDEKLVLSKRYGECAFAFFVDPEKIEVNLDKEWICNAELWFYEEDFIYEPISYVGRDCRPVIAIFSDSSVCCSQQVNDETFQYIEEEALNKFFNTDVYKCYKEEGKFSFKIEVPKDMWLNKWVYALPKARRRIFVYFEEELIGWIESEPLRVK